ncbi:MAG: PAS domain S-box protein [Endomicrobiales bacterium]|nr:PAS domain S-box protein [Endomicrobiales bacterium]
MKNDRKNSLDNRNDDLKEQIKEFERLLSVQKQTESALLESERKYRIIFDNVTDGILVADRDNKSFYLANRRICEMLGYSREELHKLNVWDIHPEKDISSILEIFERQYRKEYTLAASIPMKRKDGSIFYADVNSVPINIEGKEYLVGIFRDITERKEMLDMLLKKERKIRAIISSMDDLVFILSKEGVFINFYQPQNVGKLYLEPEKFIGELYKKVLPQDISDKLELAIKVITNNSNLVQGFDYSMKIKNELKWFEARLSALKDEKDNIDGFVAVIRDITERKEIEDDLKSEVEELKKLLNEF